MSPDPARPAFYALRPGGWRDYWTLLHPPYTLWHLSYVTIGAALAPTLNVRWWLETVAAFFMAMGLAAHALDELHGRPLQTRVPDAVLWTIAIVGVASAVVLGVDGAIEATLWIWLTIPVGAFLVLAYNLELFGGALHSDLWFAAAWGGFPVVVAYLAQTGRLSAGALVAAAGCVALSLAQRILSTPVRRLRRHIVQVEGRITLDDGGQEALDGSALSAAPERALRWMSLAVPLLAAALVLRQLNPAGL
jgi:hypothetical protein